MINTPPIITIDGTVYVRIDPRRRPLAALSDGVQAAIAAGSPPLRVLRIDAGLTQGQLATGLGVSRALIGMAEKGGSGLATDRWTAAADRLTVSLDVLLPP